MKIVIDLPDAIIDRAKGTDGLKLCELDIKYICEQVANGTPLPKGEWINNRTRMHDGEYYCSNCDEIAEWSDDGSQFLSNFCPNCGADMRKIKQEVNGNEEKRKACN